ncbi:MAG TPA: FtsX-like permease family protein [Chitinivibrionales bacterium]|nr:FtsX-like permease family protein [Chitinivibrionales bacterium]
MNLIIKIAWRNIMRHRGKSLVIGSILFFGALVMTMGNGVISGMNEGLKQTIVNSFTGDIVLVSDKQESDNVFMEFMGKAVPPLYDYPAIGRALGEQPFVERCLPAGKNLAMILNEEENGMPGNAFLVGVDFEKYRTMFPGNVRVVEGRLLDKNEQGALVPAWARKEFAAYTNIWFMAEGQTLDTAKLPKEVKPDAATLIPKTNAVLMGFNEDNSTTDIRLPVKGIIEYKALNSLWGRFVIVDIESYRRCLGYFAAADKVELSAEQQKLFSMNSDNMDALFTNDAVMTANTAAPAKKTAAAASRAETPQTVDVDAGAYNLVFVLLKKGADPAKSIAKLNAVFKEKKLGVRAVSWKKALGPVGSMATLIKAALFVFVMFLFFVAIIIIVNTLSMAALERTAEIGMMRAVGAKKGFITTMFLAETAMLSFVFGGIGIVTGVISVNLLALGHFTTTNDMVQLLFGGDTFRPMLKAMDIVLSIIQLTIVTLIAVIYPTRVAQGITPLDAVQRD